MVSAYEICVVDEEASRFGLSIIFDLEEKHLGIADKRRTCKADDHIQEIHCVVGCEMILCAIRTVSAQESFFKVVYFELSGNSCCFVKACLLYPWY